jgi:hypothetical protein
VSIRGLVILPSVGLARLAGCGTQGPTPDGRYAIDGNVTSGGKPLGEGSIIFRSETAGGHETGTMVRNGRFSFPPEQGLTPGRYTVETLPGGSPRGGTEAGVTIDEVTGAAVSNRPARAVRGNRGVHTAIADGCVRFVKNAVSLPVWRALSTTPGGRN